MKYLIKNEDLMKVMEYFFYKNFPEIKLPLKTHREKTKHNSGWGSQMQDYITIKIYYSNESSAHDDYLFLEYDDRYPNVDNKWSVNSKLEIMYDFFGEKNFEDFVKWFFGIDITDKGSKPLNWFFD